MLIDPADALRLAYHGKTYYFCSHACKREFEDRPEEYADHPSRQIFFGVINEPIRILATAMQESEGPLGH
jgi:YHS domain-containing protein